MIKFAGRFKQISLLSAAGYFFALALAAKLMFIYGSQHPERHELLPVSGLVQRSASGAMASRLHSASSLTVGPTFIHLISERSGRAWNA